MAPMLIQEIGDEDDPHSPDRSRQIKLDDAEANVRRVLLDTATYIDASPQTETIKGPIVLRFTGGWVRDKLLGVPSHDIDVAINNMTGEKFGLRMKEYLEIPGNTAKYGITTLGGLHKIGANPEKSKHLETTTTRLLGLDIDLVNLRKETYTEDSRNPQIEFGTPEEDALRRDATVNAMFYNLNTQQVEDFTGQGHKDMHMKILRTPLEPYQTFKDDPLRVLRLIRFASRLGWTIESSTLQAMGHADIKEALRRKISRERVGIELEKALRGPDPHEAIRLILELGLYETVFCDPAIDASAHEAPETDILAVVVDTLESVIEEDQVICSIALRNADERFLAWQLAVVTPYRDAPIPQSAQPGRKAPPPIPTQVAREGIKATSKICDLITACIRNLEEQRSLVNILYQQNPRTSDRTPAHDQTTREHLGMRIRAWGASWRSQIVFALLADVADHPAQIKLYKRKYSSFLEHLQKLDILDAYQLKPLLDGKALAKALSTPPGPWMKDALDVVMAWQLRHPDSTSTEDAIEQVKKHGELASSLAQHFLKLTIRPLFNKKTRPTTITEQGRRTMTSQASLILQQPLDDETMTRWKDVHNIHALDLLQWSVSSLDHESVQQVWPLLIPPILTLIDDWEIKYKKLGADLLSHVVQITPVEVLQRTGLVAVFEEALLPCLTYLPPLSSEEESLILLPAVYQALVVVAHSRARQVLAPSSSANHAEMIRSLDTIIRRGIVYGYSHTNQHPAIVALLCRTLSALVDLLGIESVKHLKYITPMLTEALSMAPVVVAVEQPTCLQTAAAAAAASSLHHVIRNCWPRMVKYRGELLRGLTLCWLNMEGLDDTDEIKQLRQDLKLSIDLLRSATGSQVGLDTEFKTLIAADSRLRPLLSSKR